MRFKCNQKISSIMSGFTLCIEFKLCELHDKYELTCTLLTDYLSFIESKILTFNQQSYKTLKARVMRQPPRGGGETSI